MRLAAAVGSRFVAAPAASSAGGEASTAPKKVRNRSGSVTGRYPVAMFVSVIARTQGISLWASTALFRGVIESHHRAADHTSSNAKLPKTHPNNNRSSGGAQKTGPFRCCKNSQVWRKRRSPKLLIFMRIGSAGLCMRYIKHTQAVDFKRNFRISADERMLSVRVDWRILSRDDKNAG